MPWDYILWISYGPPAQDNRNFLTINAEDGLEVLKGLSSPVRISIQASPFARATQRQRDQRRAIAAAVDGRDKRGAGKL
jgi:hypothetical protein